MLSTIVSQIQSVPVWSFSREVAVEEGEYLELALNCTIHVEVVDDEIFLLVTPLDPVTPKEIEGKIVQTMVQQEMWDRYQIIPSVVLYHPSAGFL